MNVIEVNGLTKFYGAIRGVEGIRFQVGRGEIFGFLGPNGAGKTTTIHLIMNLIHPDRGTIQVFGDRLDNDRVELRDRMGYLPGDFNAYREMSGRKFLNYIAGYRSRPPALREMLLEKLKLTAKDLGQMTKYLSHGTRRKLGIVFALEHDPDLVILDEPTQGLDPLMQEAFYEIILDFQQRGKTIFFSSHILREVERICHRVAIIRAGKIVTEESISALKQKRSRRLILEFNDESAVQNINVPGVKFIKKIGRQWMYQVEGNIPELLAQLSALAIEDIIFPEPNLEDIFLDYYTGENS
ncbi:MAG: ATP-binding cassette domain-containing protein [Candidatus Zhuqueibacterota bacterium]